ncbi:7TM domain-containing protein [Patescibacteria group bacterium]
MKYFSKISISLLTLLIVVGVFLPMISESTSLEAVAGEDFGIVAGKKAVFDASQSVIPRNTEVDYHWDFGDGKDAEGKEVVHIYDNPDHYKVILTVTTPQLETKDNLYVDVYYNLIVLIASQTAKDTELDALRNRAEKNGIFLEIIQPKGASPDFTTEESLVKTMLEKSKALEESDLIVTWTEGSVGLNVLSSFGQRSGLDLSRKTFVAASDKSFGSIEQIAKSTADILKPDAFFLTREDSLNTIISLQNTDKLSSNLKAKNLDFRLIGAEEAQKVTYFKYYNFLSYTVNAMKRHGVPTNALILILMLPVVATLFAFARQIVGFKTFGIFIPVLITLSFLAIGLRYGIIVFCLILIVGTVGRVILRRLRLLYLPRMAILITAVSLAILGFWAGGVYFRVTDVVSISIFPILVMIILVEQFVSAQIEKGVGAAVLLTVETLVIAIAGYYLVGWETLRSFILNTPEWIFILIPINILLGLWSGLRLREFWRFREVFGTSHKKK